jgi:hypothetical protein
MEEIYHKPIKLSMPIKGYQRGRWRSLNGAAPARFTAQSCLLQLFDLLEEPKRVKRSSKRRSFKLAQR